MRLRPFLIAAIVLSVLSLFAGGHQGPADAVGTCLSVQWFVWLAAALLAFLVDIFFGGWGYAAGVWGRDSRGNPVP